MIKEEQIEAFAIALADSLSLDANEAIAFCGYCKPCIVAYLYGKFFDILNQILSTLEMVRDALTLQQKEMHLLKLLEVFYEHKLHKAYMEFIQSLSFEQQKMAYATIGKLKMEREQLSNIFDIDNNILGPDGQEVLPMCKI